MNRGILNFIVLLILTVMLSSSINQTNLYRNIKHNSFRTGEYVKYRLKFGFINAGIAEVEIDDKIHKINGRPTYKIDVFGKTTGMLDWTTRVRDNWGTYLDTEAIIPHQSYRNIEEGKYRRYEKVNFDHQKDTCIVTVLNKETKKPEKHEGYKCPDNVLDMVSGYYFIRTLDFSHMVKGQIIEMDAFFENKVYDFDIKYLGKEKLESDIGTFETIILSPIMPKNDLFAEKDPVKFWVTNDSRKIPLQIQAELKIGSIWIEIRDYQSGN